MALTDTNISGDQVLFGDRTTSAFLSLAAQEGLVEQGIGDTDYIFDHYRSIDIPVWLQREISQQIILSPHVCGRGQDYKVFAGELLEERIFRFSPPKDVSDSDTVTDTADGRALANVTTEAVLGLLATEGINMTTEELVSTWAFVEKENFDLTQSLSKVGIQVDGVLGNQISVMTGLMLRKKTGEIERLRRRQSELESIALPIMGAFRELGETFIQAHIEGIQSIFLPRRSSLQGEVRDWGDPISEGSLEPPEAALLRVVTQRLGRLPYRTSLRESITLARSSAAKDLRELLHEWAAELPNGVTEQLIAIEKETAKAMRALTYSQEVDFGSKFITYIGGAGLVLSAVAHIPPEFGIATTIMGFGLQAVADSIQRKYNWASFGNN